MKYLENRDLGLINILHVYQQGKIELIKARPKDVAIIKGRWWNPMKDTAEIYYVNRIQIFYTHCKCGIVGV